MFEHRLENNRDCIFHHRPFLLLALPAYPQDKGPYRYPRTHAGTFS